MLEPRQVNPRKNEKLKTSWKSLANFIVMEDAIIDDGEASVEEVPDQYYVDEEQQPRIQTPGQGPGFFYRKKL